MQEWARLLEGHTLAKIVQCEFHCEETWAVYGTTG